MGPNYVNLAHTLAFLSVVITSEERQEKLNKKNKLLTPVTETPPNQTIGPPFYATKFRYLFSRSFYIIALFFDLLFGSAGRHVEPDCGTWCRVSLMAMVLPSHSGRTKLDVIDGRFSSVFASQRGGIESRGPNAVPGPLAIERQTIEAVVGSRCVHVVRIALNEARLI